MEPRRRRSVCNQKRTRAWPDLAGRSRLDSPTCRQIDSIQLWCKRSDRCLKRLSVLSGQDGSIATDLGTVVLAGVLLN